MPASLQNKLAAEIVDLLGPLERALRDPASTRQLLIYLGAPIPRQLDQLTAAAGQLREARELLIGLLRNESPTSEQVLAAVQTAWDALAATVSLLDNNLDDVAEEAPALAAALARLPQHLIIDAMERKAPLLALILRFIGAVDFADDLTVSVFRPDRWRDFLQNPEQALADLYGWETGQDWQADRLLRLLDRASVAFGWVSYWDGIPTSWVDAGLLSAARSDLARRGTLKFPLVAKRNPRGQVTHSAGLLLGPLGATPDGPLDGVLLSPWSSFDNSDLQAGAFRFEVPLALDAPAVGLRLHPGGLEPVGALPDPLRFGVELSAPLALAEEFTLNRVSGSVEFIDGTDIAVKAGAHARFQLNFAGVGLLKALLGELAVEGEFELSWSRSSGLDVDFAAGLELLVRTEPKRGPIEVQSLLLRLWLDPEQVALDIDLNVALRAGIVTVSIGGTGLRAALPLAIPLQPQATITPPTGLGITIGNPDSPVSGGGFIQREGSRYAGALQLDLGRLGLGVLGLVDATPGSWSLIASLNVSIPPIPVGFGLVLDGIGGILAWNRRFDIEVLRRGLGNGSLDALMFADDLSANAPTLLAMLDDALPPAPGSLAFGPVLRLRWGVPPILTLQLGLMVALPEPVEIVLLGQLDVDAPTAEAPVIHLRAEMLGYANFGTGSVSVDAQLGESWVVGLSLTGAMALRAEFGNRAAFLLSFGGFHPHYPPPADLVTMPRLGLGLDLLPNIRLTASAYFALTANSVQFGASVDLYASVAVATVRGGFSLDVLIEFTPFGFDAALRFYASLQAAGLTLAGVEIQGRLQGPKPWLIQGRATVTILGLPTEVQIDAVLPAQARPPVTALEPVDVAARMRTELGAADALQVEAPTQTTITVAEHAAGIDPGGALELRQSVAPFNLKLDRVGEASPISAGPFAISAIELNGQPVAPEYITDWFAPAQFVAMSDDVRVSAPGFEQLDAGVRIAAGESDTDFDLLRTFAPTAETLVWDAAVASAPYAGEVDLPAPAPAAQPQLASPALSLREERFALRNRSTDQVGTTRYASYTAALAASGEDDLVVAESEVIAA